MKKIAVTVLMLVGVLLMASGCGKSDKNDVSEAEKTIENETTTEIVFSDEMLSMIKEIPSDNPILGVWEYKGFKEYYYTFKNDSTGIYHCVNKDKVFTYDITESEIIFLFQNSKEKLSVKYYYDEEGNLVLKDVFGEGAVFYKSI